MKAGNRHISGALWRLVLMAMAIVWGMSLTASASDLGARVENIAEVRFQQGSNRVSLETPPAVFTIEARRTPSSIEFLRILPSAPDGRITALNGSEFLTNGAFQTVGPISTTGGALIDLTNPVSLVPATTFFPGEPIVIEVNDAGQNGDPAVIETLTADIETANGDFIRLRLFESGPDTGIFLAFVPSNSGAPDITDGALSLATAAGLTARYTDPFDATEISTDAAGVDPFGRVFDSATGALLDGVSVTIVDAVTGAPATVFGFDGVSAYPSTVVTGQTVTDASGFVFTLAPGEFRFPILFPGEYRLVVVPPEGFSAPSLVAEDALQTLPNAPFDIIGASYGEPFTLDGSGDVAVDIPLDPSSEIFVTKRSFVSEAAIGDFVQYEVLVENRGTNTVRPLIEDRLPRGFRFQQGSVVVDGERVEDPAIGPVGSLLQFTLPVLPAGETARLTYVTLIGPDAQNGDAINQARAVDPSGASLSNTAEAALIIRDDFLRDTFNIIGRIAADACDPSAAWPRDIDGGEGVSGIRLYTETGISTLTDDDGLYHFEALTPGLHVVQIDETTVPVGYDIVRCEETTRFAGRATSQFVEGRGGSLKRANFYLARNSANRAPDSADGDVTDTAQAGTAGGESDLTEYLKFDQAWLDAQAPATRFAYPADGAAPSLQSVNAGVMHDAKERITLIINGEKAPGYNYAGRDVSTDRRKALTRWRGIDLLPGDNRLIAIITNMDGEETGRIEKTVSYIDRVERAVLVPGASTLFADGRKEPVIAVRVTDGAGRAVRTGRMVTVTIDAPYRAANRDQFEDAAPLDAPLTNVTAFPVGRNGLVQIRLAPTTDTGTVRARVRLDTGTDADINAYLKPDLRDWIVVGLAEGGLSRTKTTSGERATVTARDTLTDGRAAVFAKGAVKGDWLVTLSADTDKRRGDLDDQVFDAVDPDDRFALYGDRSDQQFEAQSRYPVYLKAEKDAFQAEIGDFNTGLTDSRLARYPRRVTGGRAVYEGDTFRFNGFASDTNQSFARDEIAADGTSGPFRLTNAPLVRNGEQIFIETRDRFRPDAVIARTPLTRFADYDIDFVTGEIILRLPAPATDDAFNNNVIVVEYETIAPVQRGVTAGGRAAVKLAGGRAEVGLSVINENEPGAQSAGEAESRLLAGVDFQAQISETTHVRLEYAQTRGPRGGPRNGPGIGPQPLVGITSEEASRRAILAEVEHVSDNLQASLLYQETGQEFGLGQVSSGIAGARRYGGEARYRFQQFLNADATRRGERFLTAQAYREESLVTGARRDLAEIAVSQESQRAAGSVGLRWVREQPATGAVNGDDRQTLLATADARQTFDGLGLTLRASRDQPVSGDNASTLFPARTTIGLDQKVFDDVTLSVTHEIQNSDAARNANTIVGVTATPWTGGAVTVSADRLTQDSGERIGATLGVDQQVRLSDKWSASFGLTRREDLREDGEIDVIDDILPDAPLSPFDVDGAFTSLYSGLGYRDDVSTGSGRFELRKSAEGQRYTFVAGAAREVSEQLSFAGAGRFTQENNDLAADRRTGDARIGAAWRPRDSEALVVLNRFDVKLDEVDAEARNTRLVNNIALNAQVTERLQVNANHGIKYAALDNGDQTFTNWTQLAGLEARYDVRPWLDIGLQGSALVTHGTGAVTYAYGPSIGVSPVNNVWFTLGYNVEGFEDPDFAASEWTRSGPFIRLRVKFDQHDARGILNAISPDRVH